MILDGAAQAVAKHGHATTISHIAAAVGAPTGSIYHRFPSREYLLIRLWIRAIKRFHVGLLAADNVADAVRHIPQYCREHPLEASAMTLYRQSTLAHTAPADLRDEVLHINDAINDQTRQFTREIYGTDTPELLERMLLATRLCPYLLVRPYIGRELPDWLDSAIVAAALAIVQDGRTPPE